MAKGKRIYGGRNLGGAAAMLIDMGGVQPLALPRGIQRMKLSGLSGKRSFAAVIGTGTNAGTTAGSRSQEYPRDRRMGTRNR